MADTAQKMIEDIRAEAQFAREWVGYAHPSEVVLAAMASVAREHFVPESVRTFAYANNALSIGDGQTISQPYIVALMTDLLCQVKCRHVLEIGTGSGYQAAVLSLLVESVYSVERIASLHKQAVQRLYLLGYDNVKCRLGDGYLGWSEHAPYDGILVTAAAEQIPQALLAQLKPGGRLVIPLGEKYGAQMLTVIDKEQDGSIVRREVLPVRFVPLLPRVSE